MPHIPKPSEISVPKFSGAYKNWVAWRSQFHAKVASISLPPADKIDLLLKALSGEALQCVGHPERRDAEDFDRMWAKLEGVYDNRYQIVVSHISTILNLPRIVQPSPTMMRHMIDVTDQELRALDRFDYDSDSWSPMVAVVLMRKSDQATLAVWEMKREPATPPTLEELVRFLERRILAMRNVKMSGIEADMNRDAIASTSSGHMSISDEQKRSQAFSQASNGSIKRGYSHLNEDPHKAEQDRSVEVPPCVVCKKTHYLWFCHKFKGWRLDDRVKFLERQKICPCCLNAKHTSNTCTARSCDRCDGAKHNQAICPKMSFRKKVKRSQPNYNKHGSQY